MQYSATPAGIPANLAAFIRSMTKYDGYFHLLMGGALVGGILFMGTAGEAMWASINKGVMRMHLSNTSSELQQQHDARLCEMQKLFKDLPQHDPARKKVNPLPDAAVMAVLTTQ